MIFEYLLGLSAVCSLLLLWFVSPLKITLGKVLFKKDLLPEQFDDLLFLKSKFLGKLLSCWICMSFWLSLAIGIILTLWLQTNWYMPVITFLTYPSMAYAFKKLIS